MHWKEFLTFHYNVPNLPPSTACDWNLLPRRRYIGFMSFTLLYYVYLLLFLNYDVLISNNLLIVLPPEVVN